ncbi:MAG: hypothetical protein IID32_05230 [Planctomycetes bacterium]|nr:hypothetical protein [Planctomycetota bacterium]
MPGFFDVKSEKWPVWGLFASVLVVFVGFTLVIRDFGSPDNVPNQPALKCDNPDCTFAEKRTREEKIQMARTDFEALKTENPEMVEALLDRVYQNEVEDEFDIDPDEDISEERLAEILFKSWGSISRGPPFTCPTCGQKSVYQAVACQNPEPCDNIFFKGEYGGLHTDKCPKCTYSKNEERQREIREQR